MWRAFFCSLLLAGWLPLSVLACSSAPTCCDVAATVTCVGCCANTTSISLANSNITSLSADVFAQLASLQTLDLSSNNLTTVPSGLFSNNGALEHIDFSVNQLAALPTDLFSSLGNAQYINLGQNLLREITADHFAGTPRLEYLSLFQCPLGAVPADLYRHIGNVSLVAITTLAPTLPDKLFSQLQNLTVLAIGYSNLEYVAPDLVKDNANLQIFELGLIPALSSLPAGLLYFNTALTAAYLGYLNITSLPRGFFDLNKKLTQIDLSGNPFAPSGLPSDLFSELPAFSEFFLRNTTLPTLPYGLLSPTRNSALNEISLNSNSEMPAICRTTFDSVASIPAICIAKPFNSMGREGV